MLKKEVGIVRIICTAAIVLGLHVPLRSQQCQKVVPQAHSRRSMFDSMFAAVPHPFSRFNHSSNRVHRLGADSLLHNRFRGRKVPSGMRSNKIESLKRSTSGGASISVIDTAIAYGVEDTVEQVYTFSPTGKMTSETDKLWSNGEWIDQDSSSYTYDLRGDQLTEIDGVWSNGVWQNQFMFIDTFDQHGDELSSVFEFWTDGAWLNESMDVYTYDAAGHEISNQNERWSNGQWQNVSRETVSFNALGEQLSDSQYRWSSNAWITTRAETVTYSSAGYFLLDVFRDYSNGAIIDGDSTWYTYDSTGLNLSNGWAYLRNGQWANQKLITIQYDSLRRIDTSLYRQWVDTAWVNSGLSTDTYDSSGRTRTEVSQRWNGAQWLDTVLTAYTYDAAGRELTWLYATRVNGQWVNESCDAESYDAAGRELTLLLQQWLNNQWANVFFESYTFDASGNELVYYYGHWSESGQFVSADSSVFTYDPHENLVAFRYLTESGSSFAYADTEIGVEDSAGNFYEFAGCYIRLIRTNIVTGVPSARHVVPDAYVLEQNYPNPFNPATIIHYRLPGASSVRLDVYNILGQEVRTLVHQIQQAGYHTVQFDGHDLPSGIYFYNIEAGAFTAVKKMLLLK